MADSGYDGLSNVIVNAYENSMTYNMVSTQSGTINIVLDSSNVAIGNLSFSFFNAQTWQNKKYLLQFFLEFSTDSNNYRLNLFYQIYFQYNSTNNITKLNPPNTQIYYGLYFSGFTQSSGKYDVCTPFYWYSWDNRNQITAITSTNLSMEIGFWAVGSLFPSEACRNYQLTDIYNFSIM